LALHRGELGRAPGPLCTRISEAGPTKPRDPARVRPAGNFFVDRTAEVEL